MTSPLLTVVIPTYARPKQLTACLAALVGQRLEVPWEVVVVDDGSPEPLDSIAEEFGQRLDLRIERQANAGPARARNRGVAVAREALLGSRRPPPLDAPGRAQVEASTSARWIVRGFFP